ncbi:MAG: hypothetical protein J6C96_00215 [Oscillospiraceae bacterium]|nr:hypothetical protein [Oscillospiraceae bacterium]
MKKKLNIPNVITCIAFFAILLAFPIITAFLPKESFSQTENRTLQSMPKISSKSVMDRSFMNKLETFVSDHFAGRTGWIKAKNSMEIALGKYEQNGVYVLDRRIVEKIDEPDYDSVDKSIAAVNKFAEENNMPVFFMLVPTSAEIYADEIPENAPSLNQKEFIRYVYDGLGKSVTPMDAYSVMISNREKYIYYRTDHHWTTQGAYLVYSAAGKKMGYTPYGSNMYDIEHASNSFRGTFYSKALYDKTPPDTIDIYHCNADRGDVEVLITSEFGKEPESYDSMYFREYLDVKDKYSTFLGTNQPIVTIKSNNDGGKLLIIKDSYAHCYAPFLTSHYSEITLVDLRYIQISYKQLIDPKDYDQVLFLYNVSSFASDINLRKLAYD